MKHYRIDLTVRKDYTAFPEEQATAENTFKCTLDNTKDSLKGYFDELIYKTNDWRLKANVRKLEVPRLVKKKLVLVPEETYSKRVVTQAQVINLYFEDDIEETVIEARVEDFLGDPDVGGLAASITRITETLLAQYTLGEENTED